MRRRPFFYRLLLAIVVTTTLGFLGCQRPGTPKLSAFYQATYDSLKASSPQMPQLLDSGLRMTATPLEHCAWLKLMSQYALQLGDYKKADAYADSILQLLPHVEAVPMAKSFENNAYLSKTYYAMAQQKPTDTIVAYVEKFVNAARAYGVVGDMPTQYTTAGQFCSYVSCFADAAKWYRSAITLADSLQLSELEKANIYCGLAYTYYQMFDFKQAQFYYEKLKQTADEQDAALKIAWLFNYSANLSEHGKWQNAIDTLKTLMRISDTSPASNSVMRWAGMLNLADDYIDKDSLQQGEYYLNKADSGLRAINQNQMLVYANITRAELRIKQRRLAEARQLLDQLPPMEDQPNDVRQGAMEAELNYQRKAGNAALALEKMDAYKQWEDSLKAAATDMRVKDLGMRLAADSLAMHNRMLTQEKAQQRTSFLLWIALLVVCLLALALMFFLKSAAMKRRVTEAESEELKTRLGLARNRITPHFIFNVLHSEATKAEPQQAERIEQLASFIRANLDHAEQNLVTLGEELDLVSDYVAVENRMLDEGIKFDIQLSDNALRDKLLVPSMFVQIITENAVKHALRPKKTDKRLTISVSDKGGSIEICVEDNGTGFDIRHVGAPHNGHTGINVIRNSVAVYNQQYFKGSKEKMKFDVNNLRDAQGEVCGCRVMLSLPKQKPFLT